MKNPIDNFWKLKLESVKENLEKNNFKVFIAPDAKTAKEIALKDVISNLDIKTVSWGGSMSFIATGLFHELKDNPDLEVLNTFNQKLTPEEMLELRRQSLMVDLFVTGTNAVTQDGQLVNLEFTYFKGLAMERLEELENRPKLREIRRD